MTLTKALAPEPNPETNGGIMDEQDYEAYLNEAYPPINICGIEYDTGYALRQVDPTAFRVGFADWLDGLEE